MLLLLRTILFNCTPAELVVSVLEIGWCAVDPKNFVRVKGSAVGGGPFVLSYFRVSVIAFAKTTGVADPGRTRGG